MAKRKGRAPPKPRVRTSGSAREFSANAELGQKLAQVLLETDQSHQLGATAQLGIPWSTHMRWMSDDAKPGSPAADYQCAVLGALDQLRRRDLGDGQGKLDACHPAKAGAQLGMFRLSHESRFRRFYADENAKKHEVALTGKDGGPIETQETQVRYVMRLPPEEAEE